MTSLFVVSEHSRLYRAADFPGAECTPTDAYLPDAAFTALKQFIAGADADFALSFGWQRGREVIRTRNYVGLLETRDGTQLEILPKGGGQTPEVLIRMLRCLPDAPFRHLATARLGTGHLPLWEVFIAAFLDEVAAVVGQGLQQAYTPRDENARFLRGKLRVAGQIQRNAHHPERLAVRFADRTPDVPPNRLMKTALLAVQPRIRTAVNQGRARQLLAALDDVTMSDNIRADWQNARSAGRLFSRYEAVLQWAEILLRGHSLLPQSGKYLNLALLYPMETVFEHYVAAGFRRCLTAGELSVQESSRHLVDEHGGERRFRLRPDLIWRQGDRTVILDTKWKTLDASNPATNYGLDPADLYQLYAYGKKYHATELLLLYPANDTFRQPLEPFGYEENLHLRVVPVDLRKSIEATVLQLGLL
ncbi:McrC family protein [Tellurirhabdus rosea]|uniref:McrC family protein n=1 Tax=Tellurirhabdus rosea TaxID=2674997 RepID=UPI0022578D23|nr:McrC family protein [Tellurirhabdus rosea]